MKKSYICAALVLVLICILSGCAQPLTEPLLEPIVSVAPTAKAVPSATPEPAPVATASPSPQSRYIFRPKPYFETLERINRTDIIRLIESYGSSAITVQYFEDSCRESIVFGKTEHSDTNLLYFTEYVDTDVPLLAYIIYHHEDGFTHRLYIVSIFDDSLTLSFDRTLEDIWNTENLEFLDENTVLWEYYAELDGELISEIFTVQ